MQCSISGGSNLRYFSRSIHSLAKLGEEMYIHANENGLCLTTVNGSKSAFGKFNFEPNFFDHYKVGFEACAVPPDNDDTETEASESQILKNSAKCKVLLKSVLAALKSWNMVQNCSIQYDFSNNRDHLLFELRCRYSITKHHLLPIFTCESLQASYNRDQYRNRLMASNKVLQSAVSNFPTGLDEITLGVGASSLFLRNYIDAEPDPAKVARTEVLLKKDEFREFDCQLNTSVAFCLRELRAFLNFVEPQTNYFGSYTSNTSHIASSTDTLVEFYFDDPGKPVLFNLDFTLDALGSGTEFTAEWILATLASDETPVQSQIETASEAVSLKLGQSVKERAAKAALNTAQKSKNDVIKPVPMESEDSNDGANPDDIIPSSPPVAKKFRSIFLGSQRSTTSSTTTSSNPNPPNVVILAPDSDSD